MMIESNTTERQLIEKFLDTLRALPGVQAELNHREPAGLAGDRGQARVSVQDDARYGVVAVVTVGSEAWRRRVSELSEDFAVQVRCEVTDNLLDDGAGIKTGSPI